MPIFSQVEVFLKRYCPSSSPLLLALSGGADSLCLFHCLLFYRERYAVPFHVAHVDHGWREESRNESCILQQLTAHYRVPFHLKRLEPPLLNGNLEAACREARYAFFAALACEQHYQGVLTGHHQNDQAETVFKRILEGSHWSRWSGLCPETHLHGVRILRPLLNVSKSEIRDYLLRQNIVPFEDPTNHQSRYLRARFRDSLFPRLNQEFGKDVQGSMMEIGEEAKELSAYFEELLVPHFKHQAIGPWGLFLDLQSAMPKSLEVKYLLRLLCRTQGFYLSRTIVEQATQALIQGAANRRFEMGERRLIVDRKRLFILSPFKPVETLDEWTVSVGEYQRGRWSLGVVEDIYHPNHSFSSWKEGWSGCFKCSLPLGNYRIRWKQRDLDLKKVKKRWAEEKIPSFLIPLFPIIVEETDIIYEFLTGRRKTALKEGDPCWKLQLTYRSTAGAFAAA